METMRTLSATLIALLINVILYSQVGINTTLPGSTLTVNGSFAGQYKTAAASVTLDETDFYKAFNGSTAATFTLPLATAAAPASGNTLGRVYYIKNISSVTLTIAASGAELIDNQTGAGVANFKLNPAGYAMIISKGTTSGTTWELAAYIDTSTTNIVTLGATDAVTFTGTALTNFNASVPQIIPFAAANLSVNQGGSAVWNDAGDYWTILKSGVYKIDGLAYFNSDAAPTGGFQYTGINLNITKNGTALTNIIGGNRLNTTSIIAEGANTPIYAICIARLSVGDKVYLTMNWGTGDKLQRLTLYALTH